MHRRSGGPVPAILTEGLTKDFGAGNGLFDLNMHVLAGEVVGFIGTNGAGKTTTLRLIMDLIRPTRGSAHVLGMDARRNSLAIKRKVGYLPGELAQWPGMTAADVIGLLASLRGGVQEQRIATLAQRLDLDLQRRFSDLSHGNKQKVGLLTAFMHAPEVLLLDEPTIGLDPLLQREVRMMIRELVDSGASCLLSSHVLAEVELICDRIVLIHRGRVVREGTMDELRSTSAHRVSALLPSAHDAAAVQQLSGVSLLETRGERVSFRFDGSTGDLLTWMLHHDARDFDCRELSLEEVFIAECEPAT